MRLMKEFEMRQVSGGATDWPRRPVPDIDLPDIPTFPTTAPGDRPRPGPQPSRPGPIPRPWPWI